MKIKKEDKNWKDGLNKTQEWIESFRYFLQKETRKKINDKDIYTFLEIDKSSFSRYINGKKEMPDDMALEIAHYMQVPVIRIISEINAEKTKNEKLKKKWEKLAKNAVAGIATIGFIGLMTVPETNIEAKNIKSLDQKMKQNSLYIIRSLYR